MRHAVPVALAAAMVLGLAGACSNQSTATPATTSPTPVSDYGPPPAGLPLLYVRDPKHASWLIGFDWAGKPRGTVKLQQAQAVQAAPDGATFTTTPYGKGGSGAFLDRLGQPIAGPGGVPNTAGGIWADDNRHICWVTLDQQTFEWGLVTQLPGSDGRPVTVIARDAGVGQTGIGIAACSFRNDLAILVRTSIWWPSEIWAVRLSDGKVLSHHNYDVNALVTVAATADGGFVAENSAKSQGLGLHASANTIVRRVSDWTVAATLDASDQVLDFSGDGSLVLVTTQLNTGLAPSHLAVIDWRSSQVVWRYEGAESLYRSSFQPDGRDFVLALRAPTRLEPSPCGQPGQGPCRQIEDSLNDVLIFHGDGTTTHIDGRYQTTW